MNSILLTVAALIWSLPLSAFTLVAPDARMQGWKTRNLKFYLNLENCPDGVEQLIDESMELWNGVTNSSLHIERDYTSEQLQTQLDGLGQMVPGIFCVTDMSVFGSDPDTIPGQATGYRFSGLNISSASLILNADPDALGSITVKDRELVKVIIAHEIGHVLGLGHSEDSAALMYYDATKKKHMALAADDMNGISYLYPRNELGQDPLMGCAVIGSSGLASSAVLMLFPILLASIRGRKND